MEAIQFKREYRQDTYGDVTPQKIADALRIYQKYVQQYGTVEDMPLDVYTENVMAIRPLLDRLPEAFADPQTGIGADLMEIDPDMVEQNLYGQFASHLNDIMNLEQKEHPSAREFAIAKYFLFCVLQWWHQHLLMNIKPEATALCAAPKMAV